jgi:hypothetical protein
MELINFDDYVNLLNDLKKKEGEECLICHLPISIEEEDIKLKCNHHYHKRCLNINFTKNFPIKCSYCEKITFVKELNRIQQKCQHILLRGKNKGNKCNKVNCKIHKIKKEVEKVEVKKVEKVEKVEDKINLCSVILKTGKNKGNICNRVNCKIHKTNQKSDITV